ncbi:MAG: iron ABC transporter substrate-binding protein [Pseudomonadota bacterium]|nr:iron ABC transporter substrate-binding protein [Pseudomonadota bacterium]
MHFLRRFWLGIGLLVLAGLLPLAAQARTVTDLAGRQVELPPKVERVMLGEGRLLPALAILEGQHLTRRLVATMGDYERLDAAGYAQFRQAFPELDQIPRVGREEEGSFSSEQAIARRPQVAFLSMGGGHGPSERSLETLHRLQAAGVAVVFIDFRQDPLNNTAPSIELMGQVLGREREAKAFADYWRAQLAQVQAGLAGAPPGPTVYLDSRVGLEDGCCATMVGMLGKLVQAAGGRNVAQGLIPGESGTLNPELLIARQPQLYIGTAIGNMATAESSPLRIVLGADATPEAARASLARALKRRGIASLQAAQPGRAHALWHLFYNSPFNVVALQVLAKWMHPDRFASLDPHATLHTMYQRFMPIPLRGQYWVSL